MPRLHATDHVVTIGSGGFKCFADASGSIAGSADEYQWFIGWQILNPEIGERVPSNIGCPACRPFVGLSDIDSVSRCALNHFEGFLN